MKFIMALVLNTALNMKAVKIASMGSGGWSGDKLVLNEATGTICLDLCTKISWMVVAKTLNGSSVNR